MLKKTVQQGRSDFDARSVLSVREHSTMARTPLSAFFRIPIIHIGLEGPWGPTASARGNPQCRF